MLNALCISPSTPLRKRILTGTSSLLRAQYHPSESQILTLAVDGQLSYWEALDGREIRAVSVGRHGAVTALDVGADGEAVATGGQDSAAKVRSRQAQG